MVSGWHRNNTFFEQEKTLILKYYPSLHYIQVKDKIKLQGELYIKEINDSYSIEIEFLDNYPESIPIVREVGGDIKQDYDRHISDDNSCCLCVPHLEKFYFPKGSNIKIFLDKLVMPFFANQAYFDIKGQWINGEYSHFDLGIYEFYCELFNIKSIAKITDLLIISSKTIPNYNKKCPCESGMSIKKCHLLNINELKKYASREQIKKDIEVFIKIKE